MNNNNIRNKLFELADSDYKEFSKTLTPNAKNIIGVNLVALRTLAKSIAKDDWKTFIKNNEGEYYEETMLEGMVIGYIKTDVEERIKYINQFVPKINTWGVCDSFCTSLKFTKKNIERVFEIVNKFIHSEKEFEIRFALVMMLDYYINDEYIDDVLCLINGVTHDGYYVKMAAAWAVSICFIKFPEKTMNFLKNNNLDYFTYNKSLQKITESLKVDKDTKAIIRSLRRKN